MSHHSRTKHFKKIKINMLVLYQLGQCSVYRTGRSGPLQLMISFYRVYQHLACATITVLWHTLLRFIALIFEYLKKSCVSIDKSAVNDNGNHFHCFEIIRNVTDFANSRL